MAFDGDIDDYFYDDEDWLYVEDEFDLADELAESQIASPGFAGTQYEIDHTGYEFELFDYWNDLEYIDGAYWDEEGGRIVLPRNLNLKKSSKRRDGDLHAPDTAPEDRYDPLKFRSRADRNRAAEKRPPIAQSDRAYALIPDWRERFAGEPKNLQNIRPAKVHKDAVIHGLPAHDHHNEDDEDYEDDDDDDEEDAEGGIDPAILQAILKEKLSEAGLTGMDEAAFMETIAKMMSGAGDSDNISGQLADSLLDRLNGDDDAEQPLSGWLKGQGVQLDASEADEMGNEEEHEPKITEPAHGHARQLRGTATMGNDSSRLEGASGTRKRPPDADSAVRPSITKRRR